MPQQTGLAAVFLDPLQFPKAAKTSRGQGGSVTIHGRECRLRGRHDGSGAQQMAAGQKTARDTNRRAAF